MGSHQDEIDQELRTIIELVTTLGYFNGTSKLTHFDAEKLSQEIRDIHRALLHIMGKLEAGGYDVLRSKIELAKRRREHLESARTREQLLAAAVDPYKAVASPKDSSRGSAIISVETSTVAAGERETPILGDKISVAVYLDTDDADKQKDVLQAVDDLVTLLGYSGPEDIEVEAGSIFRRSTAALRRLMSAREVQDRLAKAERALEVLALDSQQADVDLKTSEAIGNIIEKLEGIPNACIRIGSLLIVKHDIAGESTLMVRKLSIIEIRAFEKFPEIQQKPSLAFQALATAVESIQVEFVSRDARMGELP